MYTQLKMYKIIVPLFVTILFMFYPSFDASPTVDASSIQNQKIRGRESKLTVQRFIETIQVRGVIECPDNTPCNDDNTCCQLTTGNYGCCAYTQATCCTEGVGRDSCCPQATKCCDGPGVQECCGVNSDCCRDGGCCPIGQECCGLYCCVTSAGASCCGSSINPSCCAGDCCPDRTCCGTPGSKCCDEFCCEASTVCCDNVNIPGCCPANSVCCDNGVCCPTGTYCCFGNQCCMMNGLEQIVMPKWASTQMVKQERN